MTTSQHSQLNLESLTSSQGDFPAKTYQLQVYKKVLPKKPDQVYFTNSSESYAWYDPDTLSWKTWQRSLIEGWTSFSGNFTKQGMMQNGQLYQQVLWEPVISEADGGLLPTPIASKVVEQRVKFKQGGTPLRAAIDREMLPTPRANQAMAANLDLPSIKNHQYPNLETVISNLPTPTARDYKDSGENMNYKKAAKKGRLPGVIVESRSTQTGKDTNLNPHFVEEMMGYPIGWTDLKH